MKPSNILIHQFESARIKVFDDEGDVRDGFYYQFADEADLPLGSMIGPYRNRGLVERAAVAAFNAKDY